MIDQKFTTFIKSCLEFDPAKRILKGELAIPDLFRDVEVLTTRQQLSHVMAQLTEAEKRAEERGEAMSRLEESQRTIAEERDKLKVTVRNQLTHLAEASKREEQKEEAASRLA